MMREIFIVRHGHSPFEAESDHKRNLSLEGQLACTKTAHYIHQKINDQACQIVCSNANRTSQTATIIEKHLNCIWFASKTHLYSASVGDWHKIIHESTDEALILVGHNPTMSLMSSQLCQSPLNFSPACVAHFKLEIKSDGLKLPAQLIDFYNPNKNKQ